MSGTEEIPQPLGNIGCQDLLKMPFTHSGWLRKRHFLNKMKVFNWPQVYVVICKGCVYYYKDEYSKAPLGKFSLYGYNSVTRSIKITPKQGPWAFQITHTHPEDFKLYYFAAASEREMKEWMKEVKSTLMEANGKQGSDYYYTYRKAADKKAENDAESVTYHEIEMKIYEDSTTFQISKDYKKRFQIKGKDEESDEDDDPPPVPKSRPVRDMAKRPALPLPQEDKPSLSPSASPAVPPRRSSEPSRNTDSSPKPSDRRRGSDDTHTRKKKDEKVRRDLPAIPQEPSESQHNSRKQNGATAKQTIPEEEKEGDDEDGGYWKAIYYNGNNSEKATELIKTLGGEGTFLVRNGTNGKVLVVFVGNNSKKYEIKKENGRYFLKKGGPNSENLEELLYEYHSLNLPTCDVKLTLPFQFHPKFKPSMM